MKKSAVFIVLFILGIYSLYAQKKSSFEIKKEHQFASQKNYTKENIELTNDTNINVLFYHIQLEVTLDSQYINGSVYVDFEIINDNVNTVYFDLDHAYSVNSVTGNCSDYSFNDKVIACNLDGTYNAGDVLNIEIHYGGEPRLIDNLKSVRYETHANNELVIATLSTPYLAHMWWPCKDGTTDKPDSVYIDITIKDTTINSIPVIAVSNGLLTDVETIGSNKTFKWQHKYPIVPYYVMFAISNYQIIQETYNSPLGYQMPLEYYVFEEHYTTAQQGVEVIPEVMAFFEEKFGQYPFSDEKYGMTQLGFYGGIENQTNTIINSMHSSWNYVIIHELAHQWFGDMITCANWHHGWVNEGFASYTEPLWAEFSGGQQAYKSYMEQLKYKDYGTLYLQDVSDPMQVFIPIIYQKGAYLLHMLRHVLGDEDFFQCLYNYANDPRFMHKNATTEDFQEICESISKGDLSYFFDQWVYDERYPRYFYSYHQDDLTNLLSINIEQRQGISGWREVFVMPVDLKITFSDMTDSTVTVYNDQQNQDFAFDFGKEVSNVEIDPDDWILCDKIFVPNAIEENICSKFVKIYPNPSLDGIFHMENLSNKVFNDIHIIDSKGQIVKKVNFKQTINLSNLKKGIYFIKLIGKENVILERISIM